MVSVRVAINRARMLDGLGKKSKWYFKGGPERSKASEHFK